MLDDYPIQTTLTVRWNDMDALGHVNNTVYFSFFEAARIRFFESLDVVPTREGKSFGFNLVATTCDFRREICYPADAIIASRIAKIGRSCFHFEHAIFTDGLAAPAAEATAVIVWTDFEARIGVELPDKLRAALEVYAGTTR